jgi:hypothetical protein
LENYKNVIKSDVITKSMLMKPIFTIIIVALFSSCDCMQTATGILIDKKTKLPIEQAKVTNVNKTWLTMETDSSGRFQLSSVSGGLCGCPPMKILIEKEGYKDKEISIRREWSPIEIELE